jgi:hypothetical protein
MYNGEKRYAEVRYFCDLPLSTNEVVPIAVVNLFSTPDPAWLQTSYRTYRLCRKAAAEDVTVISVKTFRTLIAMVPDESQDVNGEPTHNGAGKMWCAVYRPGASVLSIIDGPQG